MGRLTACLPADFNLDRMVHYSVWPDSGMAGIGSSARWREGNDGIRESEGTIVINGGNIRAKGQDNASAIGGTRAEEIEFRSTDRGEVYNRRQGGSITINGGVVRTEAFAMSVRQSSCCGQRRDRHMPNGIWRQRHHQRRHGHRRGYLRCDHHRIWRHDHHQRRRCNRHWGRQQLWRRFEQGDLPETESGRMRAAASSSTAVRSRQLPRERASASAEPEFITPGQ